MRQTLRRALTGALLLALLLPGAASAHERRDVGKLQFVVGFIGEPAILGEPNGIDLRVTRKENSEPVEGLEKVLKATIQSGGGQPKEFALRARFGMKGAYTADLIPTRAGAYVFTFTGAFEGQGINEKFESGPGRFNDVEDASKLQFPETVPFAGDLARQVQAADARASQATTFGYAGIGVGALGLLVGLAALMRRPAAP